MLESGDGGVVRVQPMSDGCCDVLLYMRETDRSPLCHTSSLEDILCFFKTEKKRVEEYYLVFDTRLGVSTQNIL